MIPSVTYYPKRQNWHHQQNTKIVKNPRPLIGNQQYQLNQKSNPVTCTTIHLQTTNDKSREIARRDRKIKSFAWLQYFFTPQWCFCWNTNAESQGENRRIGPHTQEFFACGTTCTIRIWDKFLITCNYNLYM